MPKLRYLLHYLLFAFIGFFIVALAWTELANGLYYVCTDTIPIAGFFPPFVHGLAIGDYFIMGKSTTYQIWAYLVVGIFLLPLIPLYLEYKKIEQPLIKSVVLLIGLVATYTAIILYFPWIIFILTLIAVPVFLIAISLSLIHKKFHFVLYAIATLYLTVFLTLIGISFQQSSAAPPDPLFSLDDQNATYKIQRLGDSYAIIYHKPGKEESFAYIGNSQIELEQYRGMSVWVKSDYVRPTGTYPYGIRSANTQCIQHVCHPIFNRDNVDTFVIDVNAIEARK